MQKDKTIFPVWIKQRVNLKSLVAMQEFLATNKIRTVCEDALCPNRGECYERKTATFMILGEFCTRSCRFCAVGKGKPEEIDLSEPMRIAEAVKTLRLKHVVITSVTRDDLRDGGAEQFAEVIRSIRKKNRGVLTEVLVPDFKAEKESIKKVVESGPDIFNHNLETIERFYKYIRPQAKYKRSLNVLKIAKELNPNIITKSGLMVGFGETRKEVSKTMYDLRHVGCDMLTIGQYLPPTKKHFPLKEFVSLEVFQEYKKAAEEKGFLSVFSGPFVRSSYLADKQLNNQKND